MSYNKKKLKDCCYVITDGDHLPPPKAQNGIPFITISNINELNQISFDDIMYVPDEYYNALSENKKAKRGDVLYSVVGSFGKPVYISEDKKFVFQRHIAILKPNPEIDSKFLYYIMLNPSFYNMVEKLAIGCSQKTVTLDTLRNIEIKLPPLEKQIDIISVLSKIDNKISINNKINDNLPYQSLMVA
ncbi:MAG: restriction endonuclease subunit S [Ruminococcus sp.]|nr:restriction endonuclease subunit S [Ruminococcus sp.]